jgi:subtilase family serine protease
VVDITGVPAGTYTLELTVDPEDLIFETDETNNVLRVQVTIPSDPGSTPALHRTARR